MKVKNEYVQVKIGDKTYTKRNTILDRFISRTFLSQINTIHSWADINRCYVKFDTPLEYDDINNVSWEDFDVTLYGGTWDGTDKNRFDYMSQKNNNSVRVTYNYNPFSTSYFGYNGNVYEANQFNIFIGRKITALSFANLRTIFAIVDTNDMGIYIDNKEQIQITRVDLYQSDGVVRGFEYPLHLVNDLARYDNVGFTNTKAQLYSVGFGNVLGLMEEEYLINDVLDELGDTYINLNVNRTKKIGHYPSEDLHLGFYPTLDNSKYLIFKYRLYRIDEDTNTVEYLDEYYTMSMPNETFGDLSVKLKIERL